LRATDELASQGTIADILRDKDPVGMPIASSLGRDCTPSPTTDRTQPQHATIPGSLGQTTTKKNQNSSTMQRRRHFHSANATAVSRQTKRRALNTSYASAQRRELHTSELADIQDASIPKLLCFLKRTNWFEKPNNP